MTRNLDFSTLTLKDALDLAVFVEEEAQERYEEFISQMEAHHSGDAATFFRTMAKAEAKHGSELKARRRELFGDAPVEVEPATSEVRAFMSRRQALEVAMAAEQKAYRFFDNALPSIGNAAVKTLFTELREEEVEHQAMVQRELDKLGDAEDPDPEDYVDEPVGE
jgi:rubrerythrin